MKGILLINLGTPDSPSVPDVRKYLREFLMDGRVIDIPAWQRFLLVQGIIAPFRAPESAKGYLELWTKEGSPLKVYGEQVTELLQQQLGSEYKVVLGMRYQNPSIRFALDQLKDLGLETITVIPLYPQYASASTGSTIDKVLEEVRKWEIIPSLRIISQFFEHPTFIEGFVELGREYMQRKDYDHFIFSYHGLPERQILKGSTQNYCRLGNCCNTYHSKNRYCYRAQCYATTRLLVKELGISEEDYTVAFQSRLGKDPWIKPYTDEKIKELAAQGKKRILTFSPSFIADCLETTIEIGVEYKEMFEEQGGEAWDMVESLNVRPTWIKCLEQLITEEQGELVAI